MWQILKTKGIHQGSPLITPINQGLMETKGNTKVKELMATKVAMLTKAHGGNKANNPKGATIPSLKQGQRVIIGLQ